MNWARVCLWFAFVAILSLPGARVHAQPADSPEIGDLQIGFADAYKIGHWTPLAVALHNTLPAAIHGDLVVELEDGDGIATTVREQGITLPGGKSTLVRTLVKPGRPQGFIRVAFQSAGGVAEKTFAQDDIPPALLATQELFVEVGRSIGLGPLQSFYRTNSLEQPVARLVPDAGTLPREGLGYEGVEGVIVTSREA